jgi:hypothetical protein
VGLTYESNDHDSEDPETFLVISTMEAKKNGEDDTAEVSSSARETTDDAVGVRMDVRDQAKVGTWSKRRSVVWTVELDTS